MRRLYVLCLRTEDDICEQKCMIARTTSNTCQAKALMEDLKSSFARSSSDITIEERRVTKTLWKVALREMSSSGWTCFT